MGRISIPVRTKPVQRLTNAVSNIRWIQVNQRPYESNKHRRDQRD